MSFILGYVSTVINTPTIDASLSIAACLRAEDLAEQVEYILSINDAPSSVLSTT